MVNIGNDWDEMLSDEFEKPYYKQLRQFLKEEYSSRRIYPDMRDIFNALKAVGQLIDQFFRNILRHFVLRIKHGCQQSKADRSRAETEQ